MRNPYNRLFLPVAIFRTRRGEVELQREINPARLPRNVEGLRRQIAAGTVEPAQRGGYCVRYAGQGRYFTARRDALVELVGLLGADFTLKALDAAVDLAATRQPAALAEARKWARMWQNMEILGGEPKR